MAIQNYSTVTSRNVISAAVGMLDHARSIEVLGGFGMQKQHPKNKTKTVVFRRVGVWGEGANGAPNIAPNEFEAQEGQTPTAATINYIDVSVTIKHWIILYKLSSDAEEMYEDNIPEDMQQQVGETMGELAEKVRWGTIKGGTVVGYSNGSSRAAVNTKITLNSIRKAIRVMSRARGRMTTKVLAPSAMFGTSAVQAGYFCFGHTDLEADIRDLPGFVPVAEYGSRQPANEYEIGSVEKIRFILSPVLEPFLAAGNGTLNGMYSAGGSNVDVYPVILTAQDAWGSVALRGRGAVSPTYLRPSDKNHANPAGQFGYVGGDFRMNCVRLNENWLYRLEVGVSDLT